MRAKTFIFYEDEIRDLLKESNIKDSEIDHFLENFDHPASWIHLFVEWLRDQDAKP